LFDDHAEGAYRFACYCGADWQEVEARIEAISGSLKELILPTWFVLLRQEGKDGELCRQEFGGLVDAARMAIHRLRRLADQYPFMPRKPLPDKSEDVRDEQIPADTYADLRAYARAELKGKERAVIEALADAGRTLPIADLALKDGVGWDKPFQGFKDAQDRLNPKLKPKGWRLKRDNNAATLITIGARKRG
jgi:hypothetical protein